jgi:hypothetical protein
MNEVNPSPGLPQGLNPQQQALMGALAHVLEPLATLCVDQGVAIQAIEEALRHAMVAAARRACAGANPARLTSRVSTMTGLTRREVTRISAAAQPARPASRSLVTEVFTRWAFEPEHRGEDGRVMALPVLGPAPSFEALAARVTRDVHARSLLADMQRLGLVTEADGQVRLLKDSLVPQGDWAHMVGFLGDNVGDHLRAASANVRGEGAPHFEQSVLADELSAESMAQVKDLITQQWQQLMRDMVPQLEALMAADQQAGRVRDQAVRIGMYSWMRDMTPEEQARTAPNDGAQQ